MTKEERLLRQEQRERAKAIEAAAREAGRGPLDLPYLLLVLTLVGVGLIMLFSASFPSAYYEEGNPAYYLIRQGIFAILGITAMFIVGKINYERYRAVAKMLLIFSIILLVLVLIPGIGTGRLTHGAQRWIRLGPIQFQPSEITKVGIILYFADSISKKKDKMATLRYGIVPYVAILGVIAALMAKEPHFSGMVLLLGIFYHPSDAIYSAVEIAPVVTTRDVAQQFAIGLPDYAKEVLLSILPIVAVCVLFQLLTHYYRRRQLLRTGVGFLYTVIGLILFLTGVNIGFTPVGNLLGSGLADNTYRWVLIPIGALIGYYIVKAEPAVQVLNKQVEDVTGGTVSQSMMNTALSIGVACAVMLSMVRVLTGISIYWILVPGYALALILARYVPSVFVGIAFDSGGVASGPMTSTFLLPLAMGACTALGGNVVTDAFGVVALVALAPPVAIQIMGVIYVHRAKAVAEDKTDLLPDDGVIDLEDEEI